jgi:hypothetical protein
MKPQYPSKRHKTAQEREEDLQSAIRRRAYELYEQRGYMDGSELDDWLEAESEVLEPQRASAAE